MLSMKNLLRYSLILMGASLVLAACISTSSEPEIVATRLAQEPITSDPPAQFDLEAGASLFAQNCAPCHGEVGLGDGPAASGFSCEMPALALAPPEVDLESWVDTVTNGRRTSETCIMPPWNQRMNAEQIWNSVVYATSLRHDQSLLERGESLFAEYQTDESIDFLSRTEWQADNTDADILTALSANALNGLDIPDPLPEDDQQALLVYIRAQAYGEAPAPSVAESLPTLPTEPAPQSTEEVAEAPAPVTTEELPAPTEVAAAAEPVTLTGTVINGTVGGAVPDDLELTLRIVGLDAQGAPVELYNANTAISDDGRFAFEDVIPNDRALAAIETNYSGIRQLSPQIVPSAPDADQLDLTFTIYETTSDPDAIVLTNTEMWIDAVTAEGASLVLQSYEFANMGDRIFVGDEAGRTLMLPLPPGTVNATIDAFANSGGRFVEEQVGNTLIYYDTQPVYPGAAGFIATTYDLPYDGEMEITQAFPYAVTETTVYVSQSRGLEVESEQLAAGEDGNLNGLSYNGYELAVDQLLPGNALAFRVFDGETTVQPASDIPAASVPANDDGDSLFSSNGGLILGIGILLIIGGGMFLFYDLQKRRLLLETEILPPTIVDDEDLVAAIAALDDAFEAGKIAEDAYLNRRQALKDALRGRMR